MKIGNLKKPIHWVKNVTIRKKLLLSYLILIFLPLLLLSAVSYVNVSIVYEKQIRYSTAQSFDQAHAFLSYKVNTLIKSSDVIYFNTDVQTILSRSREIFENDIVQQNIDMSNLDMFLNNLKNTDDIYRAVLYVPGWLVYSNQNINFWNLDTFSTTETYEKLMESKDKVSWLPPHKIENNIIGLDDVSVISLIRKIRNSYQISEYIGTIELFILESNLQNIIFKANTTHDSVVYIQNTDGVIISSSTPENLKQLGLNKSIIKELEGKDMSWKTMTIGNSKYAVTARTVENTDWTMVSAIPFSEILSESYKIRNLMIMLMFFLGIIAYGIAYFISTSSVKRIILLMKKMKSLQEGNLNVKIVSQSQDEIGNLTDSFNYMVKRISLLVEEQYQNGKEIKNLELKALQAQINPHFLYNTLEMINWKAIDNDVPEIAVIAQSLAKFYKLSLNKGRDIVTVADEIAHIQTYVQIQNLRFDNRIRLKINIDSSIYKFNILKLILQPIVENSIIHGILENRNKPEGSIIISGRLENNCIILTIKDEGVGMSKEKVKNILNNESTDEAHGYGVRNIDHRIKLCYGQQYGLTYYSTPGHGTTVEIRISVLMI